MYHNILTVLATLSVADQSNAGLFGFSLETWEAIIIAAISVVIGGTITYFSQMGLRQREEKIRVVGLLTEKRINSYEKIIEALDTWGSVTYNTSEKSIKLVEALTQNTFSDKMLLYPIILTSRKSLLDFNALWQSTIQNTHLYIDENTTKQCRLISWYLSILMETFDVQFLDIMNKTREQERAINQTMTELGCIIFNDYHLLADPVYRRITKYLQSPKLTVEKESLRDIHVDQVKEFIHIAPKMNLFKYRLVLRRRILEIMGYSREKADELLQNDSCDFSEINSNPQHEK
jgi:hypothetical protein